MKPTSIQLSIHLLPEFGWVVDDQPVYGPGSTFQGFVRVTHTGGNHSEFQEIDHLRILFYASETIASSRLNRQQPIYEREQFFGSQRCLWSRKDTGEQDTLLQDVVHDFYFTIEMPMVQFPPSMLIPGLYSTKFCLVASLEGSDSNVIVSSDETPLRYMPLIESRSAKLMETVTHHPPQQGLTLVRKAEYGNTTVNMTARLESLNYVAGDQITVNLLTDGDESYDPAYHLILTQNVSTRDGRCKTTVVSESQSGLLDLPRDLSPSVSYSKLVSVQYKLKVIVSHLPSPASESASTVLRLSRLLRPKPAVTFDDIPIHIGTLAYGLKASADLKPYSAYHNIFTKSSTNSDLPPLPVPHFATAVELKDILPVYEDYQLPTYEQDCLL